MPKAKVSYEKSRQSRSFAVGILAGTSMRVICISLLVLLCACPEAPESKVESARGASAEEFRAVLAELAESWNQGNAGRAAQVFTSDAIYSQPPEQQLYRGRDALYRFFGGDSGRPGEMQMRWHHLAFDEDEQVGFGEFSFTYGSTAHGVAVIRLRDGKISNWREYWYESSLPWHRFTEQNPF